MAAKKPEPWRKALPRRVNELQRAAEKQMRKTWENTVEALPPPARKTVKQLTARAERTRHELRKRGEKAVADLRKRGEHLRTEVEKRVENALKPMTRRLDFASRTDVDRLHKRLHDLERRIEAHGRTA